MKNAHDTLIIKQHGTNFIETKNKRTAFSVLNECHDGGWTGVINGHCIEYAYLAIQLNINMMTGY